MKPRILIATPVRQTPEVFREYLCSLENQETDGVELACRFTFHNSRGLIPLLEGSPLDFSYSVHETDDAYIRDRTHRWSPHNLEAVADMKNMFIHHALEGGYDYIWFVDSDLVLHPRTLKQLLYRARDIIANVFWTAWNPGALEEPNAWDYDQYNFRAGPDGNPLAYTEWRRPGCYLVGGTGACILISRRALEAGVNYSSLYNLTLVGEDRHFSIRAVALGFTLWLETTYPSVHLYREEDYLRWVEGGRRFSDGTRLPPPR